MGSAQSAQSGQPAQYGQSGQPAQYGQSGQPAQYGQSVQNRDLSIRYLEEAELEMNMGNRQNAQKKLRDALNNGANTTDPRVAQLKTQLGLYGGKRRKSKRSSKPKRKSRRKQRT